MCTWRLEHDLQLAVAPLRVSDSDALASAPAGIPVCGILMEASKEGGRGVGQAGRVQPQFRSTASNT